MTTGATDADLVHAHLAGDRAALAAIYDRYAASLYDTAVALLRDPHEAADAVQDTILRRMHDYVHYIVPQFARTHINFQRVPVVDTSNPFIARDVPTPDESMVVIRFKDPRGVDFPYLLRMIHDSFMSRANTIVIPGGKLDLAMQLILTPLIWKLVASTPDGPEHMALGTSNGPIFFGPFSRAVSAAFTIA